MPNTREKLIELINASGDLLTMPYFSADAAKTLADYLIENGVTVQNVTKEAAQKSEPKTNADRIRAMSDKELAEFINHFNICDLRTNDECKMSYCACCEVCVMDWLQQPLPEPPKGD